MSFVKKGDTIVVEDCTTDSDSDEEEQVMSKPVLVKKVGTSTPKIVNHNTNRPKSTVKTVRKPVRYCEQYRTTNKPRGNQRNWNNLKSNQLGDDFAFYNKACYICGSFDHLAAFCNQWVTGYENNRVNYKRQTPQTHFHSISNFNRTKPRAVSKAVSTARPFKTVNPRPTVKSAKITSKHAPKTVHMPIQTKAVVQKQV